MDSNRKAKPYVRFTDREVSAAPGGCTDGAFAGFTLMELLRAGKYHDAPLIEACRRAAKEMDFERVPR